MKYLQIYDHNGNLTKEFPVYIDGEDFNWVADKPEAIWLGTIRLVSEPSGILVTTTPELEPLVDKWKEEQELLEREGREEAEAIEAMEREQEEAEVESQAPFITREPTIKVQLEVPEGYEEVEVYCTECGLTGQRKEFPFGHDDFVCPECGIQSIKELSEVKREKPKSKTKAKKRSTT